MLGRYFVASALALAIDYGTYWLLLVLHPGLSRPAAASAAYLIGAVVHYFISRRFVFAPGWLHARHWREFALFLATGLAGAAVTALVVALVGMVPGSGIHWPKIAAVVVSFFAVYLARKYLVFRNLATGARA
jgi:putative flippase GtrA